MTTKEEAYSKVSELIERFNEQIASYKKTDYNEALTRKDFIDPFFKALGWDVDNSFGYAEAYREVIHEDKVKVGGATKAPDYSFRLPGGHRLFFVEAKKPSVFVKDEILPAYQVRRYGWSAKLPISLITDFEEFAIYDCTKKPNPTDKASHGRIKYLTYKDYLHQFDFLWDTFSKERVLKGSFDKFIKSDTQKKGTATVDKDFLASLNEWRKQLALNIALRNQHLTEDDLNFAVQQNIDRIIFLRIAEDRGVEEYGELKQALQKASKEEGTYYKALFSLFKEADSKYNSGLFDFKKDTLSRNVTIDNKVLKNIINELYYPACPYAFDVLSVEILGSAYEQFLGKQIKLDKNHKAVIEEKPEVRKAGGVYYTPQYIVNYIVENTVGKLTAGKTPEQVSKITIVDPACGSGSFLLGAYDYLLKWHLEYYKPPFTELSEKAANGSLYNTKQRQDFIKQRNKLPLTPEGHLTTALKKQILLNNIYGVDIDTQAVEVTKLSLLLKCMEGETGSSINAEMRFGERVLPTLDNNIKSGNSLIDLDFYDNEIEFGEDKKIKPFNWQQAFPAIFSPSLRGMKQSPGTSSGFDVVIGNPPYVGRSTSFEEFEKEYIKSKYAVSEGKYELYQLFIEKAIKIAKSKEAFISFITPQTWLSIIQATKLRRLIIEEYSLKELLFLGKGVFNASVDSITFTIATGEKTKEISFYERQTSDDFKYQLNRKISIESVSPINYIIPISGNEKTSDIIEKIKSLSIPISEIGTWYDGVKIVGSAKDYAFQNTKLNSSFLPMYAGSDIERYHLKWGGLYCCRNKQEIEKKGATDIRLRSEEAFNKEKILVRKTGNKIIASIDKKMYYYEQSLFGFSLNNFKYSIKLLLAILNSNLSSFLLKENAFSKKDTFPQVRLHWLKEFPIIENLNTGVEKELLLQVEVILLLKEQKHTTTLPEKIEHLNQRIAYTDEKINKLVYELYGLSEEEIGIVEGR